MEPFSLTLNGGPQLELEALRLSFTGMTLNSLQMDTATLSYNRAGAASPSPIADDDEVAIWLEGRRLFVGRARIGRVGWGGVTITLRGPWSWLDEFYWQVTAANGSALGGPADGVWTSRMPMFGPSQTVVGGSIVVIPAMAVLQQLEQILAYAKNSVGVDFLPGAGPLPDGVRDLPLVASVKRTVQDLRLSEAIRQCLAAQPDAASWYDYSGEGVPSLNFRAAGQEVPVAYAAGQYPLVDYDLDLLHELRLNGVAVAYESAPNPLTGRGLRTGIDRWPLTAASGPLMPGVLLQTMPNLPTPIYGAAKGLYDALLPLRSSGSIVIQDSLFTRGLRPGMTLQITGDTLLEAEPVQHWVQSVRWTPATGQAVCTVGYPAHLGLRERLDLARFCRRVIEGYRLP